MSTISRPSYAIPAVREKRKFIIALWVLHVLVAAFLFSAGISKLAGAEEAVVLFDNVGIGQWLRYVTGMLEIIGSVLLLIPSLSPVGALLLAMVMTGAIGAHLFVIGGSFFVPFLLLTALLGLAWVRRDRITRLRERAA